MSPRPAPSRYLVLLVATVLVLGLDQGTKLLVDQAMDLQTSIPVIPDFFNITYVRNQGAAFSFLADSSFRLPFFILVAIVAMVAIGVVFSRLRDQQRLASSALSLIFAGALGNLVDRVRLGEVIDFLDAHWYEHHWPVFNVADIAICIGVGLLALDMWREERDKQRQAGSD